MKLKLKRVEPLQAGKLLAGLYGAMGLLAKWLGGFELEFEEQGVPPLA